MVEQKDQHKERLDIGNNNLEQIFNDLILDIIHFSNVHCCIESTAIQTFDVVHVPIIT